MNSLIDDIEKRQASATRQLAVNLLRTSIKRCGDLGDFSAALNEERHSFEILKFIHAIDFPPKGSV